MAGPKPYPQEFRERAVRWSRRYCRTSTWLGGDQRLRRANAAVRRANKILKAASASSRPSSTVLRHARDVCRRASGPIRRGRADLPSIASARAAHHPERIPWGQDAPAVEAAGTPCVASRETCAAKLRRLRSMRDLAGLHRRGVPRRPDALPSGRCATPAWPESSVAGPSAGRRPTRGMNGLPICSSGTAPQPDRTGAGWPTTPTSPLGPGSHSSSRPTSWRSSAGRGDEQADAPGPRRP